MSAHGMRGRALERSDTASSSSAGVRVPRLRLSSLPGLSPRLSSPRLADIKDSPLLKALRITRQVKDQASAAASSSYGEDESVTSKKQHNKMPGGSKVYRGGFAALQSMRVEEGRTGIDPVVPLATTPSSRSSLSDISAARDEESPVINREEAELCLGSGDYRPGPRAPKRVMKPKGDVKGTVLELTNLDVIVLDLRSHITGLTSRLWHLERHFELQVDASKQWHHHLQGNVDALAQRMSAQEEKANQDTFVASCTSTPRTPRKKNANERGPFHQRGSQLPPKIDLDLPTPPRSPVWLSCEQSRESKATSSDADNWERCTQYTLSSTVWSSSLFVGLPAVGYEESALVIFLILVKVLAQALFAYVLLGSPGSFARQSNPDPDQLLLWRIMEGQHLRNAWSSTSLSSRVCGLDGTLSAGRPEMALLEEADFYLERFVSFVPLARGTMLSAFVLLIWFLRAYPQIIDAIDFIASLCVLPRGAFTHLCRDGGGSSIVMKSLSLSRRSCLVGLHLLRVAIDILVLLGGVRWIASTTDIEGMFVNAAVLAFVLELDSVLFHTFTSTVVRELHRSIEPLSRPSKFSYRGKCLFIAALLICAAVLSAAWSNETLDMLKRTRETLCGGNADFVYENQAKGDFYFASSLPFEGWLRPNGRGNTEMVSRLIHGSSSVDQYFSGVASLSYYLDQPLSSLRTLRKFQCIDDSDSMEDILQQRFGTSSCAELRELCIQAEHEIVRAACPATCGCALPRPQSGGAFWSGCPSGCREAEAFQDQLGNLTCGDASPSQLPRYLLTSQAWVDFFAAVGDPELAQGGCQSLQAYPAGRQFFCLPHSDLTRPFFTLRFWCPDACGCRALRAGAPDCPPSCAAVA